MTKARDLANAASAFDVVTPTEVEYLDGVTSAIQTQVDSKLSTATAASTYQAIVAGVDDTEIGYLNGVTSAIQTQMDGKQKSITVSTSDPTGGADGDIWIKYTP